MAATSVSKFVETIPTQIKGEQGCFSKQSCFLIRRETMLGSYGS
jgi:hypothetical protein